MKVGWNSMLFENENFTQNILSKHDVVFSDIQRAGYVN